jgi:hypothetical protein
LPKATEGQAQSGSGTAAKGKTISDIGDTTVVARGDSDELNPG